MRAGKLDKVIRIETYSLTGGNDGFGNPTPAFVSRGNFRAEVVQGTNEEFFRAGGIVERVAVVFRTRYVPSLSTIDRVAYLGKYFDIQEVRELGRRQGNEIRCISTGTTAPP